jgi:hypothetical protein
MIAINITSASSEARSIELDVVGKIAFKRGLREALF